jgi:hypothetical protein
VHLGRKLPVDREKTDNNNPQEQLINYSSGIQTFSTARISHDPTHPQNNDTILIFLHQQITFNSLHFHLLSK